MKRRVLLLIGLLLFVGAIGIGIGMVLESKYAPASKLAAGRAATLQKWLAAYAEEHHGAFPSDLSQLDPHALGAPEMAEFTSNVIEYRGAGLTTSSDPKLVLMRFSVKNHPELEGRTCVSGSTVVRGARDFQ